MSQGYRVQDPTTGEVVEEFDTIADAQLDTVLATAVDAQTEWAAKTIEERAEVVRAIADLFEERKDRLAAIIGEEMGKRASEGVEEAEFSAEIFRYYADNAATLAAEQPIETPSGSAVLQRLPVGVLLGIMPWNFPYYQVARFAAPNLMLGNGIILKHAEICPRSAAAVQDILTTAGVPEGVYTTVYASHDQVSTLIADPRIAGVSLTGSDRGVEMV